MYFTNISQKHMQNALIVFGFIGWDCDGLSSGDLDVLSDS